MNDRTVGAGFRSHLLVAALLASLGVTWVGGVSSQADGIETPSETSESPAQPATRYTDESGRSYKGVRYGREDGRRPIDWRARQIAKRASLSLVSWVGFEQHQAYSRVFVETNTQTAVQVTREGDRVIVLSLPGATIAHRNSLRDIDASAFSSPVERVEIIAPRRRGQAGVVIRIHLNRDAQYTTTTLDNAFAIDILR